MKILLIILFLIISACSSHEESRDSQGENPIQVDILDKNYNPIGKGVPIDRTHILTVSHVYEQCAPICILRPDNIISSSGMDFPERDIALLVVPENPDISLKIGEPRVGEVIKVIRGDGSLLTGTIQSLSENYIGYDQSLGEKFISGAILTDIVLTPGESGTPVWTLSGDLLGVMSAVDAVGKRGWVVRFPFPY